MPRKKPTTIIAQYEFWTNASVRTGTIVARLTSGNISRAPNLSVSAPTGMRPSEPTTTGTATSRDWAAKLRPRRSLMPGPSGPSRAQAQKLTRKPIVATVRLTVAFRPNGVVIVVLVGCGDCPTRAAMPADRDGRHGCGRPRTGG